jgi:tetratricopeptide (TPR) repeat protein
MSTEQSERWSGKRIAVLGKLAGMARRDLARMLRAAGGTLVDEPDDAVDFVILGEADRPTWETAELASAPLRARAEAGQLQFMAETEVWQALGLVDIEPGAKRLYTPAMLADLLQLPLAMVRRWQRRGLIVPVRVVRRLAYFDYQEIAAARRLAELLAAGLSPGAIEKKLAAVARWWPRVERPLAQLSVIVEGRELLFRAGEGLVEAGGQRRLDFDLDSSAADAPASLPMVLDRAISADELRGWAHDCEDRGQLTEAAEMLRSALTAGGPSAVDCFDLAEILYRLGDLPGARERYFMAVELDEEFVEARANLGCVLAELGEFDLAAAAFSGALSLEPDYPDAHFHLAHALDDLGRVEEANEHWRRFLELAPEIPWAEEARSRLGRLDDASTAP